MDTEAFTAWALDPARDTEERYMALLLIERGVSFWHAHHRTGVYSSLQETVAEKRERRLNPAFDPRYTETNARRACEMFPRLTTGYFGGYGERPLRDLTALRFLDQMESVTISNCEATDLSSLTAMPALTTLSFASAFCDDFRALARCKALRNLSLSIGIRWPEVAGLEALEDLDTLSLGGNLLAFPPGLAWPRVRIGTLNCTPLCARDAAALPFLPQCEFLTLSGVDRLDGIERYTRLRNLTLAGPVRSLAPLGSLTALTSIAYSSDRPRDISPLAKLPRLHVATFHATPDFHHPAKPRDYSPLTTAPALREIAVSGCPPVEMEIAALNAGFPPCDDLWLAETPRPLPPLRFIIAPGNKAPRYPEPGPGAELPDTAVQACESRWVQRYAERTLRERIGYKEWGEVTSSIGLSSSIWATVEAFDVVEKLPLIVDALRSVLAALRRDYLGTVMISLRVRPPEQTPAQKELEQNFRDLQERADFEQRQRDQAEYLEKLHLHELSQQEGDAISPEEFAPTAPVPDPVPPWEADEEDEDDQGGHTGLATKTRPDPPPSWLDDEHPLASNYRLLATLTLDELWCLPHHRDLAIYLMGRQPDLEIPEDPKPDAA